MQPFEVGTVFGRGKWLWLVAVFPRQLVVGTEGVAADGRSLSNVFVRERTDGLSCEILHHLNFHVQGAGLNSVMTSDAFYTQLIPIKELYRYFSKPLCIKASLEKNIGVVFINGIVGSDDIKNLSSRRLKCPPCPDTKPKKLSVPEFDMSSNLAGSGTQAVAVGLNKDCIPPQRGMQWTSTTIRGILKNEKFIGDVLFQKTYTDDNFIRHNNDGVEDKYYLENHHEAIISREDFEAAASILAQRGKEKGIYKGIGKYSNRYAFSGIITCGECGSAFKRRIHMPGKPGQYVAWCCNKHIDTGGRDCSAYGFFA